MKIYREVDGIIREFELTPQEMAVAYYEKEHEWDIGWVLDLAEMNADEDMPETVERLNALRSDRELLSRVAHRYRKYMDDAVTGDEEFSCFDWAYKYIAGENMQNPV